MCRSRHVLGGSNRDAQQEVSAWEGKSWRLRDARQMGGVDGQRRLFGKGTRGGSLKDRGWDKEGR